MMRPDALDCLGCREQADDAYVHCAGLLQTIDRGDGDARTYGAGESWHEGADDPVVATASPTEDTAFVRVLVLPADWAGRRTIRYFDPADEDKPRLQRASVLLEVPL